jgi:hypothetical protein
MTILIGLGLVLMGIAALWSLKSKPGTSGPFAPRPKRPL